MFTSPYRQVRGAKVAKAQVMVASNTEVRGVQESSCPVRSDI